MPEPDTTITFRIPPEEKARLQRVAEERGITLTEFLQNAGKLLAAFHAEFLDGIGEVATKALAWDRSPESIATVVEQLLETYLNSERADIETFGAKSQTFVRAFQHDENGLIRGDRHAALVYEQRKADNLRLLAKIKVAARKNGPTVYAPEEMAVIAGVRREAART